MASSTEITVIVNGLDSYHVCYGNGILPRLYSIAENSKLEWQGEAAMKQLRRIDRQDMFERVDWAIINILLTKAYVDEETQEPLVKLKIQHFR